MEKLKMTLSAKTKKELETSFLESMKDENFKNFVSNLKISKELAMKNNSKIKETVDELKNCKNCKGLFMCKNRLDGYVYFPEVDEDNLIFNYVPCKYQKALAKQEENQENELANARMKDIDITDKKRIELIKWLKDFYDKYEKGKNCKGLYLHGSFGSGKTFLLACLLNELTINKNVNYELVYFPEFLRNLKEDFTLMEDKVNYLEKVEILVIDDIGAENVTNWGRDEILGTILQSRMNNHLTTFFTSNYTIEELEQHLALTKGVEDTMKAKRIIERIKQLTTDIELISKNRRK